MNQQRRAPGRELCREGAAMAAYRDLRLTYYGSQSYDFTEPGLARLAQQSLATNKPDDALAWVKLNLEFYPKSAQTFAVSSSGSALTFTVASSGGTWLSASGGGTTPGNVTGPNIRRPPSPLYQPIR